MLAGVLAATATTASVWWHVHRIDASAPDSAPSDVLTHSETSIAVLPFRYEGEPSGADDPGAGLANEIVSLLSRFSQLVVIDGIAASRNGNSASSVEEIGQKLGVRYLLNGEISRTGGRFAVVARLADSREDGRGWTYRFDGPTDDLRALRHEFARKIVSAMAIKIERFDIHRVEGGGTKNPAAYDAFVQGRRFLKRRTAEDTARAAAHFRTAVSLDPGFSRAHAALALSYLVARRRHWHEALRLESKFEAENKARAALREAMKTPTSLAHRVAAGLFIDERRVDEAVTETEYAIALDPNDPENYALRAIALIWSGRPEEAVEAIEKAIRLNPLYPAYYQTYHGIAKYCMGDFQAAYDLLKRAHRREPDMLPLLTYMLAAEGQLGLSRESAATLANINALRRGMGLPPYSLWEARFRNPFGNERDVARLMDGLRKANVPSR